MTIEMNQVDVYLHAYEQGGAAAKRNCKRDLVWCNKLVPQVAGLNADDTAIERQWLAGYDDQMQRAEWMRELEVSSISIKPFERYEISYPMYQGAEYWTLTQGVDGYFRFQPDSWRMSGQTERLEARTFWEAVRFTFELLETDDFGPDCR